VSILAMGGNMQMPRVWRVADRVVHEIVQKQTHGGSIGTNQRLFADGRVFMERDHTFTSFQRYRGPIYRDAEGPRDIHALDYPYGGLVVEVIDSPDAATRERVLEWLRAERVPSAGSPVAMGMTFQPMPLPPDKSPYVKDVEGVDTRLTILGTDGFIEVRKNVDIAGRPGESHLFLVDQKETRYIDCSKVALPYGEQLVNDVLNRTETAMTQAHCYLATELVLKAQQQAQRLAFRV